MGDKSYSSAKHPKKRHTITFAEKISIINRAERGECLAAIGRDLDLSRSTITTIVKDKERIRNHIKNGVNIHQIVATRARCGIMEEMERLLKLWMEEQNHDNVPLSLSMIQEKARKLHEELRNTIGESSSTGDIVPFNASWGWFRRFRIRARLQDFKVTGESASADVDAVNEFPGILATVIEDGDYVPHQIFSVTETVLFWKKMPANVYGAIEEKSTPGYNAAKDCFTLLLGSNVVGDMKLVPLVVYHSENPRALKGVIRSALPVIWKSNCKTRLTPNLFADWFTHHFVPSVEKYSLNKNLEFKALLILDNTLGHSTVLENLHPKIKVLFLPLHSGPLLQPVDETIISIFKLCYLKMILAQAVWATDTRYATDFKDFWKGYSILHAVWNIGACWGEMKDSTLNGGWRKLFPKFVKSSEATEETPENVTNEVVIMGRKLDLNMDTADIRELVKSHTQGPSTKELNELKQQVTAEQAKDDRDKTAKSSEKSLNLKHLGEIFRKLEDVISDIEECDPDVKRSSCVVKNLRHEMACYKEMYDEKRKGSVHLPLENFHKKLFRKSPISPRITNSPPKSVTKASLAESPSESSDHSHSSSCQ